MLSKVYIAFGLCCLLGAQTGSDEEQIRVVLASQVACWNRGDIQGFMETYEKSDTLTFVGKTITRGHSGVLANYRKSYPTQEKMGRLDFEIVEVKMLGPEYASVIGKWTLARKTADGGDTGGIYTLVFKKSAMGWKIILDHTS